MSAYADALARQERAEAHAAQTHDPIICPKCGGSLDTGFECLDCGYDATPVAQPATSQEPFGYWVTQKHADPVLLRKPSYIPEPSDRRTVTPLYAATPTPPTLSEDLREALRAWEPEGDDRVRPLLLAEADRRDAVEYNATDANHVIAFLLHRLDAALARAQVKAS